MIRSKKGAVKLPIFKLPPVESKKLLSVQIKNEVAINTTDAKENFIAYHDHQELCKAILKIVKDIPIEEMNFIRSYLMIASSDIVEIERELVRNIEDNNSSKSYYLNKSNSIKQIKFNDEKSNKRNNIVLDFFLIDDQKSLFLHAREISLEDIHYFRTDQNSVDQYPTTNSKRNPVTAKSDMSLSAYSQTQSISRFSLSSANTFGMSVLSSMGYDDTPTRSNLTSSKNNSSQFPPIANNNFVKVNNSPKNLVKMSSLPIIYSHDSKDEEDGIFRSKPIERDIQTAQQLYQSPSYSPTVGIKGENLYSSSSNYSMVSSIYPSTAASVNSKKTLFSTTAPTIYNSQDNKNNKSKQYYYGDESSLVSGLKSTAQSQTRNSTAQSIVTGLGTANSKKRKSNNNSNNNNTYKNIKSKFFSDNIPNGNLTTELISSLRDMERHTMMVKKDIATIQELVLLQNNTKAKPMLYSVAAESMRDSLLPIIRSELRRGWIAWSLMIHQQKRQENLKIFIKFLTIRNIVLGLKKLLSKVLNEKWKKWKLFTNEQNKRLKRLKVSKAILLIQTKIRALLAIRRVKILRARKKYQKLYDSTIMIQAIIRGSLIRKRLKQKLLNQKKELAVIKIQYCFFIFKAKKRVHILRIRHNKELAIIQIQKIVRAKLSKIKVISLKIKRKREIKSIIIQKIMRGYLARKNIQQILINRAREKYVVCIQAKMRSVLTRINMKKYLKEIEEYKYYRLKAVIKMQSIYRGYRIRLLYKMKMYKLKKKRLQEIKAANIINLLVRRYISKAKLRKLKKNRFDKWVADAKRYQEMWSDEASTWYYYNASNGESLWEPSSEGYTKFDGKLVLFSGEIIDDPTLNVPEESEEEEEHLSKGKHLNKYCSECAERIAIRFCENCGDKYCTKCYKNAHQTGSRRNHIFNLIGPIECTECESLLAERWCVSCDEAFCDSCWRRVHSKGKRTFHPFCIVFVDGKIDNKIQTIDGEVIDSERSALIQLPQLENNGYDNSNYDYGNESIAEASLDTSVLAITNGIDSEWTSYYDDQGYEYWYNNYTGVSQYENPYQ
eukprot:gene6367-8768_t